MAGAVPMMPLSQTSQPTTESGPAASKAAVANGSPTSDENSTENGTSAQPDPPVAGIIEIQDRFSDLRSELLDGREKLVDWWLVGTATFLTLFGLGAVGAGYLGFKRFHEIKVEARKNVTASKKYAEEARSLVEEIKAKRDEAESIVEDAEVAAKNPDKTKQAVNDVHNNPKASLMDKARAAAVSLQQQGKRDDAVEKWQAIAHVAEGTDNDLAASAWFSIGYLIQNEDQEDSIRYYDKAILLKSDLAKAYNNRGIAKYALGCHQAAIADYDQTIFLKPCSAKAYNNRGIAKYALGCHQAAIADYDRAILLNPNYANAYNNRGEARAALGCRGAAIADYDQAILLNPILEEAYSNRGVLKADQGLTAEAQQDFHTALVLARNSNNVKVQDQAEQGLSILAHG